MIVEDASSARFFSYVSPPTETGCRLWIGGKSGKYGKFWLSGRTVLAHRVAFAIHNGRWPEPVARHKCDTPLCCEASHLEEGTHLENVRDCIDRGRRLLPEQYRPRQLQTKDVHYSARRPEKVLRGERIGTSKLNADQVRDIRMARADGEKLKPLAARYGVSETMISYIARGKWWAHA